MWEHRIISISTRTCSFLNFTFEFMGFVISWPVFSSYLHFDSQTWLELFKGFSFWTYIIFRLVQLISLLMRYQVMKVLHLRQKFLLTTIAAQCGNTLCRACPGTGRLGVTALVSRHRWSGRVRVRSWRRPWASFGTCIPVSHNKGKLGCLLRTFSEFLHFMFAMCKGWWGAASGNNNRGSPWPSWVLPFNGYWGNTGSFLFNISLIASAICIWQKAFCFSLTLVRFPGTLRLASTIHVALCLVLFFWCHRALCLPKPGLKSFINVFYLNITATFIPGITAIMRHRIIIVIPLVGNNSVCLVAAFVLLHLSHSLVNFIVHISLIYSGHAFSAHTFSHLLFCIPFGFSAAGCCYTLFTPFAVNLVVVLQM